ncbi:hypothetical protein [Novosphingobium sp.]|uniref:hypothetical protein n=1 Tax=Novosphingobium sp. TaxID=1874826 RepID=UPI003BAAAD71
MCGAGLRRLALIAAATACLGGCSAPVVELPPSLETIRILRNQNVPPMALGPFTPASKDVGHSISIRLGILHPPKGRNFAEFLGATFETELKAAGKLDPAAPLQLGGVLTESRASEDIKNGGGSLGARITLSRGGQPIFAKDYRAETKWHSSIIGALAIDEAFVQYNALYAALVRQALSDPELVAAAKR